MFQQILVVVSLFICIITANSKGKLTVDCSGTVAFSASGVYSVYETGLIRYKKTIFDSGHGWNQETGVFTAICPGIYYVSFNGFSQPNNRLTLKERPSTIGRNSGWVPIISIPSVGGSNSVIIQLLRGEQIAIISSGMLGTDSDQVTPVTSFNAFRIESKVPPIAAFGITNCTKAYYENL